MEIDVSQNQVQLGMHNVIRVQCSMHMLLIDVLN